MSQYQIIGDIRGPEDQRVIDAFAAELQALMSKYGVEKLDVCWSPARLVAAQAPRGRWPWSRR